MTKIKPNARSKTELLGYIPLEKRIAQLQVAGLRTMLARDSLYDELASGRDAQIKPPLLPRHFEADMADVSELYRFYKERRRDIEDRIKDEVKRKAGVQGASPVNPAGEAAGDQGSGKAGEAASK